MADAPATFAEYLKASEMLVQATDAALVARWGDDAPTIAQSSGLTSQADASAELARQAALTNVARGNDVITAAQINLAGLGRSIAVTAPRLGYAAGLTVPLVGIEVDLNTGLAKLEVMPAL